LITSLKGMSFDEHTREFEKLLIRCDIQEPQEETIVRYFGRLEPKYSNVIELQQYSSFDEVCVLANKVEQQRKRKTQKREFPKPVVRTAAFHKENSSATLGCMAVQSPVQPPVRQYPPYPQRTLAPQTAITPLNYLNPSPKHPRRCFKSYGLGHIAADCPNQRVITLMEWDAVKEDMVEEEKEEQVEPSEEEEEEIIVEPDEGEMLVL